MELLWIGLAALFAAGLTLFSGFGLGTLLTPVFALFFPLPLAIAGTAVVHLANNVFKLGLLVKHADWRVVWRFGLPAMAAAVLGALLLAWIGEMPTWLTWSLGERPRPVEQPVMSQVVMQCGRYRVVSLISTEAANELGLEPGVVALAQVKATNVSIVIKD